MFRVRVFVLASLLSAVSWDGTIYNPSKMTPQEFASAMCIGEVFYAPETTGPGGGG
ncbi:MAG: hypothetical protein R3E66_06615 [bacterium]